MAALVRASPEGLWCEVGGFHVDPWKPVARALITHAHSDHARAGCQQYLCSRVGVSVLRRRVHSAAIIEGLSWGEKHTINGVSVSFHPAGHILGSAQIRLEYRGEVWVVSGDYKMNPDPSCDAFEPIPCHTFITESTFGLPIYRWPEPQKVFAEIHDWWSQNQQEGRTSVILSYPLGKSQRLLSGLDARVGPLAIHPSPATFVPDYAAAGRKLAPVSLLREDAVEEIKGRGLVIAPAAFDGSRLLKRLGPVSLAFASGWMQIRGVRRGRGYDRGFVLSDHVDWPGLMGAIKATGAQQIGVTHGQTKTVVRYLQEVGYDAFEVPTRFMGETLDQTGEAFEEAGEAERNSTANG